MESPGKVRSVAIACGGTGGHLFPGLAVAERLRLRGWAVSLLVSPKEVDQQAVRRLDGVAIVTLPAVGLSSGRQIAFVRGFWKSYRACRQLFAARPPEAVLAMGGFTSAPPVLAGRRAGAKTFLHESNTIPGRANRWLSWIIDQAFVGFPEAASRLHTKDVTVSGTPVRPQFAPRDAGPCRAALGLDPQRPVVLVMGGSQGATSINDLVLRTLPTLAERAPQLQWLHLAGVKDCEKVRDQYARLKLTGVVHAFFEDMPCALGAAAVAVSRAGASSLAELAAMQVPSVLIPFPAAADNHQLSNALAFEKVGAARLLEQRSATAESLSQAILDLLGGGGPTEKMRAALGRWHAPPAAQQIAEAIISQISQAGAVASAKQISRAGSLHRHQSAWI